MFSEQFESNKIEKKLNTLPFITRKNVETVLSKEKKSIDDLTTLLSPIAQRYLEEIAHQTHHLTKQRFGNTMQVFIPMYLSNLCYNTCTYCGFSIENKYPRKTLSEHEILKEAQIIKDKGFQHILLLTGEAETTVNADYISNAIKLITPTFKSIGIEIQPLSETDYLKVKQAGADSLTLYQETYHPEAYKKYHLYGKKKNYTNRLNAVDRAKKANFYRLNIGALLGLYKWQYEALALAEHIQYLQKNHWQSKLSISFPRIKSMVGNFNPEYSITDKEYVQLICAFRLIFPDLGITLSTRESEYFRNNMIKLGITTMSAESKTSPGGYSNQNEEEQFETSDHRTLNELTKELKKQGYETVLKDWEKY